MGVRGFTLGVIRFLRVTYRDSNPTMENQMEKIMENEVEAGLLGLERVL